VGKEACMDMRFLRTPRFKGEPPWLKKALGAVVMLWLVAAFLPALFFDLSAAIILAIVFCVVVGLLYLAIRLYCIVCDEAIEKAPKIAKKGIDVGAKTVRSGYKACQKGVRRGIKIAHR